MTNSYSVSGRNKVKRKHQRGSYDHDTVHAVLDASLLCHVSYVIDGQPYCTPTIHWRNGTHLYWHGSSASRMLRNQAGGVRVCVTVALLDGFVMAHSGFDHSANYRSAMCFGQARIVDDLEHKTSALNEFIERYFPGRNAALRPVTPKELKATTLIMMEIEEASAKIREGGIDDADFDADHPVWTGVVPIKTIIGERELAPKNHAAADAQNPDGLDAYKPDASLSEVLASLAAKQI